MQCGVGLVLVRSSAPTEVPIANAGTLSRGNGDRFNVFEYN